MMCLCFWATGNTSYVNSQTILLNTFLIFINHLVVMDAKRNSNTLLFILGFMMIAHYAFRIVSLNFFDYSLPFMKGNIDVSFVNDNLLYIIVSECIMWLVLHVKMKKIKIEKDRTNPSVTKNILKLLIVSYILSILTSLGVPLLSTIIRMCASFFFNMQYMILLGVCYFLYYKESISRQHHMIFICSSLAYVVIYTLLGSRGTLYNLGMAILIAILATGVVYVKKKYVIAAVMLVPIALILFLYGSFMRFSGKTSLSASDIQTALSMSSEIMDVGAGKDLIAPAFDRLGYFDYSLETINNKDELGQYIKPINYVKSIIDNLLTPGFNIYDMPRMSFIPDKLSSLGTTPSYKDMDLTDDYMSSQFSIYGESYLLFGIYGSFLFYFIVCLCYKRLYLKYKDDYTIFGRWAITIILYTFYVAQRSYGYDWWFIELFGLVINYYIFSYIVKKSKKVVTV